MHSHYLAVGKTLPRLLFFPFIITIHLIVKQFLNNVTDFKIAHSERKIYSFWS